jgi:hypothetical protein
VLEKFLQNSKLAFKSPSHRDSQEAGDEAINDQVEAVSAPEWRLSWTLPALHHKTTFNAPSNTSEA